jgi:hypothetical protein
MLVKKRLLIAYDMRMQTDGLRIHDIKKAGWRSQPAGVYMNASYIYIPPPEPPDPELELPPIPELDPSEVPPAPLELLSPEPVP